MFYTHFLGGSFGIELLWSRLLHWVLSEITFIMLVIPECDQLRLWILVNHLVLSLLPVGSVWRICLAILSYDILLTRLLYQNSDLSKRRNRDSAWKNPISVASIRDRTLSVIIFNVFIRYRPYKNDTDSSSTGSKTKTDSFASHLWFYFAICRRCFFLLNTLTKLVNQR